MVPPASHRISRVLRYSGTGLPALPFGYGSVTLSGGPFQNASPRLCRTFCRPTTPPDRSRLVWAPSRSLAATWEIDVSFFSSGYLDVSVPRVPPAQTMDSSASDGTLLPPGSPIQTSTDQSLLAAPRGFSQLATSFFGVQCHGIHPVPLVS